MELIFGGTGSGKSAFGEHRACGFSGRKIYLATMEMGGEAARERVLRHREMRQGKGFVTVEQSCNVGSFSFSDFSQERSCSREKDLSSQPCVELEDSVILLECLGTLLANEMFSSETVDWKDLPQGGDVEEEIKVMISPLVEKIFSDILVLRSRCRQLIVISSDVFGETGDYSVETTAYLSALGMLHRKLVPISVSVWELVYGIPILWKGCKENSGT